MELRGDGNETRKKRLEKIKKGPGVFVYTGEAVDHEWEPTVLKVGRNVPVFNAHGMPVLDASGRQVFEKQGRIVRDEKGNPVLGGEPKKTTKKIETYSIRGVDFPEGEKIAVSDPSLALKLRCLGFFEEIEEESAKLPAPKPRGPKAQRLAKAEAKAAAKESASAED